MAEHWYKNALLYCLDVKSFADGNGDGIGDFVGLKDRLQYLAGLNVDCVWLQPFHPSPMRDNGYDITDYYGVDPRLGTLGDFEEFSRAARDKGLRGHDRPGGQPHVDRSHVVPGGTQRSALAIP